MIFFITGLRWIWFSEHFWCLLLSVSSSAHSVAALWKALPGSRSQAQLQQVTVSLSLRWHVEKLSSSQVKQCKLQHTFRPCSACVPGEFFPVGNSPAGCIITPRLRFCSVAAGVWGSERSRQSGSCSPLWVAPVWPTAFWENSAWSSTNTKYVIYFHHRATSLLVGCGSLIESADCYGSNI